MRKNLINWKRSPKSAACQLICPGMLMLILVYVRYKIQPTVLTGVTLAELETPQYQIQLNAQGDALDLASTTTLQQPFQNYYNYELFKLLHLTDEYGPELFNPSNCLLENSWVLPKVSSSWIALVGVETEPIMQKINSNLQLMVDYWAENQVNNLTIKNFTTMAELNNYISSDTYLFPDEGICFGIAVNQTGSQYEAKLIFDDQDQYGGALGVGIPKTNQPAYNSYSSKPNNNTYQMLTRDGYAFAQNLVANAILQSETGVATASISTMNIPLPADKLVVDQFSAILSGLFPFFLVLIYLGPVYSSVYGMVQEKEQRSKESMRMMGMTDFSYWASWICYYVLQTTIISLVGWLLLCINVISNGSGGYIFLYMWMFGVSIIGQIITYQALFSRAKYSGLVSIFLFFMLQYLNLPLMKSTSGSAKFILSFVPQVDASQMAVIWADYEENQLGLNHDTVRDNIQGFTFLEGLLLYIPSTLLWCLFGFYLEAVLPKQYGSKSHPCFCFFPSTYKKACGGNQDEQARVHEEARRSLLGETEEQMENMECKYLDRKNYEPVSSEVARQQDFLRIEDLEKVYDNGFHAVKGMNVKIYQNQIFALLGQNGAGKSTTIGVLTGLIQATKGKANVFGYDMFTEADKVRQLMGICPQHDVLFENLTPREHLDIFYDFKGGNPDLKQKEIDDLIKDVGLTLDQDKKAGSLSGGNKRKLSVAISLCGGSKLVLLDEPTAGMDLGARRDLWNMLKNYRRDKIIILTTHYMDEADVLGDRIGIMAQGKMMCLGTSLFLKRRFGAGYKITMVKTNKQTNTVVEPYLQQNLGGVQLLSEVASEITFQVNKEAAKGFKNFFEKFDQELSNLGILSYGVSITTLEEVFLKINQEFKINIGNAATEEKIKDQTGQNVEESPNRLEESQEKENLMGTRESLNDSSARIQEGNEIQAKSRMLSNDEEDNQQQPERLIGNATMKTSIRALLIKRFNLYKRDRTALCCELVAPFICVLIGCLANNIDFAQKSYTILVQPDLYPSPQRILYNDQLVFTNDLVTTSPDVFYFNLPQQDNWQGSAIPNGDNSTAFYQAVTQNQNVGPATPYRYGSYQWYRADNTTHTYQFATYLNLTSPTVTAYYPQYMYQSVLKTAVNVDLSLETVPFPPMYQLTLRSDSQNAFGYAAYVGFAFCFMPCAIISFIVLERTENLRHMQIVSGLQLSAYWISNMIADMVKLYIPIVMIILCSIVFNSNYDGCWILMLMLPPALVPFTYCTSFLFNKDNTAQLYTLFITYAVCCLMSIIVFVLQFIPQTFTLGGILRWSLCIFPSYCVINGILWSSSGVVSTQVREQDPSLRQLSPGLWGITNLGGDALCLVLHFVFDTLLLVLIELNAFKCVKNFKIFSPPPRNPNLQLDSDVLQEEERVRLNKNDVIRVCDFRKAYQTVTGQPYLAVERISFGLDYGECFALLGVNGAGKTTTFKSLTADTEPTEGEITVAGHNIQTDFEQARKLIGYCPQKDAIFNLMTVEEHIWYYGRIKGINEEILPQIVEKTIVELNLADHRDKCAGTLSGGNKRKLSVAMATLGNPPIILLDEPSAGMDPEARRFMWTVVERISQRDKKSAVILTTHSMEEAEALSTKMGIMVRGGIFKCIGSSQHIKNKFGTGYECEIKIRKPQPDELVEIARSLNMSQNITERVSLEEAKRLATQNSNDQDDLIVSQIKVGGLGSDLVFEAGQQNDQTVRLANFATYLYTMRWGLKCAKALASQFSQVELIEQCSDFFKFRIPRDDKTIGYLFGNIEDKKNDLHISEYSVSQTSLEQIFQQFANQSILEDKATLVFTLDGLGNLRTLEERRSTLGKRHSENNQMIA